jgi:hypothetical protein
MSYSRLMLIKPLLFIAKYHKPFIVIGVSFVVIMYL